MNFSLFLIICFFFIVINCHQNIYQKTRIHEVCQTYSRKDCRDNFKMGSSEYDECKKDSKHSCRKFLRKWLKLNLEDCLSKNLCHLKGKCTENLDCGYLTNDCQYTELARTNDQDSRVCSDKCIDMHCKYFSNLPETDIRIKNFCGKFSKHFYKLYIEEGFLEKCSHGNN